MIIRRGKAVITLILAAAIFFTVIPFKIEGYAQNASLKKLKPDVTYKSFDVTGDGKKDVIRIKQIGASYDFYTGLQVLVNGKVSYQVNDAFYDTKAKLISLRNGKKYLYLYSELDDYDGPVCAIMQYKNGKFKKVVDLRKLMIKHGGHPYGEVTGVSGNTVKVRAYVMSYSLGPSEYAMQFTYSNGTLKQKSSSARLLYAYINGKKTCRLTARTTIKVYKSTAMSKVSFKLKRGDKVTIDKCRISSKRMLLHIKCGYKSGWIKATQKAGNYNLSDGCSPQFLDVYYAG